MAQLINGTTIAGHTAIHAGNLAAHSIATTSYVTTQISNLINGAPGALDTLNELAAALGNDASFSSTLTNSLAAKLALSGGTMTGNINWAQTDRGITWGMNTDGAYIKFFNTGDGDADSRLEYSTSDNGDEYHRWMISGTEKMTLKGDGLRVANTIYASGGNSSNWNTAYGWGNHASAGYQAASTAITTSNIGSQSVNYAASAGSVAWTNVSSRPTALSQFTNDLGNYGGFLTSVTAHTHSIGDITDAARWWNNMGQNHSTYTDFNSVGDFGFRFVNGSTNGPGTGSSQFYGMTIGLGNDYALANYAMQLAIPRYNSSDRYITFRTREATTWGSWYKIYAGYADSAGGVAWTNVSSRPTALSQFTNDLGNYGGFLTSLPSHNHDGIYVPINPDGDGPAWAYSDNNPTINGKYIGGGQSFGADGSSLTGGFLQARLLNAYDGHINSSDGYYVGLIDYGSIPGNYDTTQVIDSSGRWTGVSISDAKIASATTWNTAYNKRPTAISFSGTGTKTLTLTLGDSTTLTASFTDIDTDTNTDAQTLSISGNTLSISGGNSVTLSSSGISQATADGLYVAKAGGSTVAGITYFTNGESLQLYGIRGRFSGEAIHLYNKVDIGHPGGWGAGIGNTPNYGLSTYGGAYFAYNQGTVSVGALGTAKLHVIGNTSGQELFAVDGVNGRLFSVVDDLSDSLYSVNTLAGLPVLEVFANNVVTIGKFGTNAIYVGQDGRVGFGTTDFSYTTADQTSPTNNRLFVNGSIQLLGNNDAIVFGRGTATVLRDEKLAFGWGSGWYMEDADYLRVLSNKTVYSGGSARFDSYIYIGGASYYLYQANSGIWTNGNLGASGDLYLGTRGTWLSSWLNQNVQTGADPTFNSVYLRDGNLRIYQGDGTALRVVTAYGWMNLGAQNGSWTHMYASLPFYFNYDLYVNGTQVVTNSGTWSISISGNAGTVGGLYVHGNRNNEVNKIVRTDANGYIQAGWINTPSGAFSSAITKIYCSDDDYIRYQTPANFISNLGLATTSNLSSYLPKSGGTMTGTITITSTDIRSAAASGWTGDPGAEGKIQYHSNRWYIVSDSSSAMIVQFRRNGTDVSYIDNSGTYIGNVSGSAGSVAWGNVSSRPTALSQFSNDLGNYGGFLTSLPSHTHDDRYYTETEINNFSYFRDNEDRTLKVLRFTGVGGDSGNSSNHSYAIYQGGGSWSHPYPDLHIGYHTGIKIGANTGYGGTRFYDDSTMVTELFSVGNGDTHVRVANNLYAGALFDAGSRVAISRGEGRNYVDYSRYVYNNGAYSGSGWIEPSDLGVRYAASANYATSAGSAGSASSASYAGYLPTLYAGGQQTNPQVYFNNGIGLRAAMTGAWSVWSDTLWVNGYSGGDVRWMCALHFLRNSEPRMAISAQTHDSSSYGSYYEVITAYNIGSQSVNYASNSGNANSISNAVGGSYTWTSTNYFASNQGGYLGSLSSPPLQAYSSSNNSAYMSFHKGGQYAVNMGLDADNVFRIGGWSASSNRLQMDMSGNLTMAGDITAYSDARVKTNIHTIENALDKTLALRGVSYNRTDSDDTRTKIGVIAQETLEVVPEVVNQDNDGMYNVSYGNMTALLIEAIKEQQAQIEELKAEVKKLRGE